MEIEECLKKVAHIECRDMDSEKGSWFSNFDSSYLAHVGMEESIKHLADLEITGDLTHGVWFSTKDNKWYGWSPRAIYGFTIGSECKKGDCHYTAKTPEELIDDHANFFSDISEDCEKQKRDECQILDDRSGIRILHTPVEISIAKSEGDLFDVLQGKKNSDEFEKAELFKNDYSIIKCGRGEWTAKTMEDAKQMAVDFNEGVS